MAESIDTDKKIEDILTTISRVLDTEVVLTAGDDQKLTPHFDVNGFISKMIALFVYAHLIVPTQAFMPSYNQVNADIEYWKKKFEAVQALPAEPPAGA